MYGQVMWDCSTVSTVGNNKCYFYFLFSVISTEYVLLGHGSMTFL